MNYKNILGLGLLVFSTIALQPAHAFNIKDGMKGFQVTNTGSTTPGNPPQLTPIRLAKGRYQVIRTVVEFDPQTGLSNVKRDTVCIKNVDVAVYDARASSSWGISGKTIECMDNYQGEDIRIGLDATLLYSNQSMFGEPPQDYKNFLAFAYTVYTKGSKELPKIPFQSSFTKDLNQTSFGLVSTPGQAITCETSSPNDGSSKTCTVTNPIAYEITWEAEDRP